MISNHAIYHSIQTDDISLLIDSCPMDRIINNPVSFSFEVRGYRLPEVSFLHYVVIYRKPVFVEYFVQNGFHPDFDPSGCKISALCLAVLLEYCEIVEILIIYGADINKCDVFGVSPLSTAVSLKNERIIKILLRTNQNILDLISPLRAAISTNQPNIVSLLLQAGADPSAKCLNGTDAFSIVQSSQGEIMEILKSSKHKEDEKALVMPETLFDLIESMTIPTEDDNSKFYIPILK